MDITQRIRKAINWLIFQDVAESEKEIADRLGYTKSSFSQIVNGKVPLSEKFVRKLCSLDENINDVWITNGEGSLLKTDNPNGIDTVTIPAEVWAVVQAQTSSLAARDRQVDELINLLRSEIEALKKNNCPEGRRCHLCRCRIIGKGRFQCIIPKY